MSKTFKKMFVLLLSVAMVFTMMAMPVYADEGDSTATEYTITNNTGMFKLVKASMETTDAGEVLTIALSGSGYRHLFKGTYEDAVDNDEEFENWIDGYENAEGKWEFKIPVAEGETYIPLVAISEKYYQAYLTEDGELERAFFPRQLEIDREAKTVVSDDYHGTVTLAITNNVSMFKPGDTAVLRTDGGPNSNNFGHFLTLTMGSNSYTKVELKPIATRLGNSKNWKSR